MTSLPFSPRYGDLKIINGVLTYAVSSRQRTGNVAANLDDLRKCFNYGIKQIALGNQHGRLDVVIPFDDAFIAKVIEKKGWQNLEYVVFGKSDFPDYTSDPFASPAPVRKAPF